MVKIFIDPGHGGSDSGAVGNGLLEKNLTLQISRVIRDLLLQYENVSVRMSREGDQTLTLNQRTNMANAWGADFVLSVHINAGGGTGYEDFRHSNQSASSVSGRIQREIHAAVMTSLSSFRVADRGVKAANFHMLRESDSPAVLTENLFIDNAADANLLKQSEVITAIAVGHVQGIVSFYNLQGKPNTITPEEDDLMAQPFNPTTPTIRNSVATVLARFEQKDPALARQWREQFLNGQLTISDAIGLLYVAIERGYIEGNE